MSHKKSNSERMKKWRASLSPEMKEDQANKNRARVKLWRLMNPEKWHEQIKRQNASATSRNRKAKYRKNHPEIVRFHSRTRQAQKRLAMPHWVDANSIFSFYNEARRLEVQTGIKHHVDHIIPLKHEKICGLHCEFNLRVIPASENYAKNNRFNIVRGE